MSSIILKDGVAEFTVATSDKLAVYSKDAVKVYQKVGYPNFPDSWDLLQDVAAGIEYITAAFSADTEVRIVAGAAEVLYQAGISAVPVERRGLRGQGTPGVLDATGALTAAMITLGIVTSAAAAVTATLPTGAVMDTSLDMAIGDSFDWSVIKVGANSFTVAAAATGHTVVGTMVVATATSAIFRTRKTAAATYVTYRIG